MTGAALPREEITLREELLALLEGDGPRGVSCPRCGSSDFAGPSPDGFIFCRKCHRRMPRRALPTDDRPIKEP